MDAELKAKRNMTAFGAPFHPAESSSGIPWSVPDALIHTLSGHMTEKLFELSNIPDHFIAAGFTDADLVLGEQLYGGKGASFGWMAQVLKWNPKAKAGESDFWTWAPPQPTIADRLRVALYALSIDREKVDGVFFPGAHGAAQRGLNELLLANPVLMHPRVRVNIGLALGAKAGTCSVAHAIALTPNAHFPMPSDWPAGLAPMTALRDFANSTVVLSVLRTAIRSPRHRDELETAKGRSYFASAVKLNAARPALLNSLYSLGRLMDEPGHGPAAGRILEDWKALHRPEDSIRKTGVLTASFFAACGVMQGRRTREQAALYREDGFFEYVAGLFEDEREKLLFEMRGQVFQAIFGKTPSTYGCDEVSYNLRAVVRGMAQSKLLDGTEAAAALWVRWQLKEVGAPAVDAPAALGFVRVMRNFEIELLPEHFNVFKRNGVDMPFEDRAPGWAAALRIDAAERAMREVFERAPAAPTDCVTANRRRRARI